MISNQEGEEECTSSKEELEKETMSPLDHALIQTKPNSLETELAIENIFSMIDLPPIIKNFVRGQKLSYKINSIICKIMC